MYSIIDTHTHGYFPKIEADQKNIFEACEASGVKIQIQIGCDEISSQAALNLAQKHQDFYATLGVHPCDVLNVGIKNPEYHRYNGLENYTLQAKNLAEIQTFFETIYEKNKSKIVGFGETGFDLYHENSKALYEAQKENFARHIDLCEKYNKPLIVHTREARSETLEAFKREKVKERKIRGVIHCFSEDTAFGQIMTEEYGFFLGIGGVITYKNTEKIQEAVAKTPIEYLVTETDSPFLMPRKAKNKKEKINHPGLIPEIIEKIAELKEMEPEAIAPRLFENGKRLFGLK